MQIIVKLIFANYLYAALLSLKQVQNAGTLAHDYPVKFELLL